MIENMPLPIRYEAPLMPEAPKLSGIVCWQLGIEGMMLTSKYALEHHFPCFGICLWKNAAVIGYARHAAALNASDRSQEM